MDATIDEDGRSELAAQLALRWTADPTTVRFFRSSSNFLYSLLLDGQEAYLRFSHNEERNREQVEAEVELLTALENAGLRVAVPIPSRSGRLIESIAGSLGVFHAVVIPALAGERHELDDLSATDLEIWGASLAHVHVAMMQVPRRNSVWRVTTWLARFAEATKNQRLARSVRGEAAALFESLQRVPTGAEWYGLTHLDFEPDNVVWDGRDLGILDFDDCSPCWYVADVIVAIRDTLETEFDADDPVAAAFISGYRSVRALPDEALQHGTMFLRASRLQQYLRLCRAVDVVLGDGQPPWFRALLGKLQTHMKAYELSLGAASDL